MKQLYKFRPNIFFQGILTVVLLCTLTCKAEAKHIHAPDFRSPLTVQQDTTKPILRTDSSKLRISGDTTQLLVLDTLPKTRTDTFSLKISKDSLDAPLKYAAEDSAVVLIKDKKIILYGKTKTEYKDIVLTAPKVEVDQSTQIVTAVNSKDSTGEIMEVAHFKSGESEFTSDTIKYNFKTQIGLTKNTFTSQGELQVHGDEVKKVNENTTFIRKARFTTCNLDDPHFAFVTPRMKVINKKLAISGPAHPEFEGVPVPIYLPFGFYPLSQGRHSGLLPPQFATNEQFGLGLEGLGYYKVISNYWDVKFYGNIYSYGGWNVNVTPTYRKRYRYNGTFTFSIQNTRAIGDKPVPLKNKSYAITWNHAVDNKARPGTTFSANVNAGSTKFNEFVPNSPQTEFSEPVGILDRLFKNMGRQTLQPDVNGQS